MKFLRAPIAIALSVLYLSACTPHHSTDTARVSLMTYNVENLFDTVHDEGKDDYAYLPLSVKQAHPEYLATCPAQRKTQTPERRHPAGQPGPWPGHSDARRS